MHIHERVLEAANRISSRQGDGTFTIDEVVRALPTLNQSSVRTHVGSRCCVNAPKNHLHKWDYFRRVGRGKYQVLPKHRKLVPQANAVREVARKAGGSGKTTGSRRDTIHAVVHEDRSSYVAECLELAVVTQGRTLDEVIVNLQQALALHLEDEDLDVLGLAEPLRLQLVYDVPLAS